MCKAVFFTEHTNKKYTSNFSWNNCNLEYNMLYLFDIDELNNVTAYTVVNS